MTKVIIALPGRTYSGRFMMNLINTIMTMKSRGYEIIMTNEYSSYVTDDTEKYPVVSGLYRMEDLTHYACVKKWDIDYFKKTGTFEFMKVEDFESTPKFIPVAYNGMGFFACRKGVIEKLKYPYFSYPLIEIEILRTPDMR